MNQRTFSRILSLSILGTLVSIAACSSDAVTPAPIVTLDTGNVVKDTTTQQDMSVVDDTGGTVDDTSTSSDAAALDDAGCTPGRSCKRLQRHNNCAKRRHFSRISNTRQPQVCRPERQPCDICQSEEPCGYKPEISHFRQPQIGHRLMPLWYLRCRRQRYRHFQTVFRYLGHLVWCTAFAMPRFKRYPCIHV
jgi:hypothetical protein